MGKISAKDYIGWVIAIICAFIAGGFFTQKEQLQSENIKLVRVKQEVNNSAKTIQQYIITNNYNLPEPIKINLDNIATVSGDSVVLGGFSDKK